MDYGHTLEQMRSFVRQRSACSVDEFWVLQHHSVYTQGYTCSEYPAERSDIPVVSTDRGGQMTYHGPGQLIVYLLIDLRRRGCGARRLAKSVESAIVRLLSDYGIAGEVLPGAPGVYVAGRKIASLGFRILRGCCYHGLSLNVDIDTQPFEAIDICGIAGLEATSMADLGTKCSVDQVADDCVANLVCEFGYAAVRNAPSKAHWQSQSDLPLASNALS